jgi:NAD-dependent dihydropyrimidine dehydrogenase PreA subunit
MKTPAGPPFRVVLYEGRDARPLPDALRVELMRTLLDKGYAVTGSRAGARVAGFDSGTLLVLGLFEGGPPASEGSGSSAGEGVRVVFRDIAGLDAAAVLAAVESVRGEAAGPGVRKPGAWKPWFPVIDYGRCTNCMQCLSFCLFDVYGVSEAGKIQVRNQDNCKTDCPACSRVCPEVAILFPKYRQGPINGDEVNADDVRREAMKIDISALLGGDIYSMLRDRSAKAKSRFGKERDEERALRERKTCLAKLKNDFKDLDIPAEVLASLPSPDQIAAKAREAQARAEEALRRSGQKV